MEKLLMIIYGELSTKKDNIGLFLKTLKNNIEYNIKNVEIKYDKGRMFLKPQKKYFEETIDKLQHIFGIQTIHSAYKMQTDDIDEITKNILTLISDEDFKTFKVKTKRSNKDYPLTSMQISAKLGHNILQNLKGIKVDVGNPQLCVNVEIRKGSSYIYFDNIKGLGGYPTSVAGKGLLMLSGGIDSPVAGYLSMKRGIKLEAIYFESPPHTSKEAKNKVIELAKKLALYNNDIKLHIINFTHIQEEIYKNIDHSYLITIMRRMMYRISAKIAYNSNAKILINGESIGQVASQTLMSMSVINQVVSLPVIRPLACFDKLEIIQIAKEIDTYDTSILPYEDCCTIFVPKHPVINPSLDKCLEYEKLIDYEKLIFEAIKEHEVIKISATDNNNYNELL